MNSEAAELRKVAADLDRQRKEAITEKEVLMRDYRVLSTVRLLFFRPPCVIYRR